MWSSIKKFFRKLKLKILVKINKKGNKQEGDIYPMW